MKPKILTPIEAYNIAIETQKEFDKKWKEYVEKEEKEYFGDNNAN